MPKGSKEKAIVAVKRAQLAFIKIRCEGIVLDLIAYL
jgi:hypothetical protein